MLQNISIFLEIYADEQARALVMAAAYGMTAAEVADAENIPLGTAKTRIRTGMIRLRGVLDMTHCQ